MRSAVVYFVCLFFFFFKQKTAYEMRISDWSSDVCSSDLWYTQGGRKLLYWHWSPNNGWALDHEIHGWNECLITYVLAVASPTHAIDPLVYHRGYATGRDFINGKTYHGIALPLGQPYGGPMFFAHYSFRSDEHTSEIPSQMRSSYAVF